MSPWGTGKLGTGFNKSLTLFQLSALGNFKIPVSDECACQYKRKTKNTFGTGHSEPAPMEMSPHEIHFKTFVPYNELV